METKKIVDALILGGVLVVSLGSQAAFAINICNDGVAGTITVGSFIQTVFPVKCSANVQVDYADISALRATTKGMSKKGMHSFGGSTEGGAIKACETASISYTSPIAGTTLGANGCS
jgi:hypothetical protein